MTSRQHRDDPAIVGSAGIAGGDIHPALLAHSPARPTRRSGGGGASKQQLQQSADDALESTQAAVSDVNSTAQKAAKQAQSKLQQLESEHSEDIQQAKSWVQRQYSLAIEFTQKINQQPLPQQLLVAAIFLTNFVIPLFFLHRPEAKAAVASYIASSVLALFIYERNGRTITEQMVWSRIHFIPLIVYLLQHAGRTDTATQCADTQDLHVCVTFHFARPYYYTLWVQSVILLDSIALLMDGQKVLNREVQQQKQAEVSSKTAAGGFDTATDELGQGAKAAGAKPTRSPTRSPRARSGSRKKVRQVATTTTSTIEYDVVHDPRKNAGKTNDSTPEGRLTRGGQIVKGA